MGARGASIATLVAVAVTAGLPCATTTFSSSSRREPRLPRRSPSQALVRLRGGALDKLAIARESAIGVATGKPLTFHAGGGFDFLIYSIGVYFAAMASVAACCLVIPIYWLLPFLVSISVAVPVACREEHGSIRESPPSVLRRCRVLTSGKKFETLFTFLLCSAIVFVGSYALLLPVGFVVRLITDHEQVTGFVSWFMSTYVGLAFSYMNFVVYDGLIEAEVNAKDKGGRRRPSP